MSNQSAGVVGDECCSSLTAGALESTVAADLAVKFKALGDPVRIQLFAMIASADGEVCVCDLTCAFDLTAPTISHHLKTLRLAGLVTSQRRGTWVYYRVVPQVAASLSKLLDLQGVPA